METWRQWTPFCVQSWRARACGWRPEHDGAHGCPLPRAGRRGRRLCHQSEWSGASFINVLPVHSLGTSRRGGTTAYEPELKGPTDPSLQHVTGGLVWSGLVRGLRAVGCGLWTCNWWRRQRYRRCVYCSQATASAVPSAHWEKPSWSAGGGVSVGQLTQVQTLRTKSFIFRAGASARSG